VDPRASLRRLEISNPTGIRNPDRPGIAIRCVNLVVRPTHTCVMHPIPFSCKSHGNDIGETI